MAKRPDTRPARGWPITLKALAQHLGLSIAAVSVVLNDAPGAAAIPERTKKRIWDAARDLGYAAHPAAQSLKHGRTWTIGVIVSEFSEGYVAGVLNGIEAGLRTAGYLYFVASHHFSDDARHECRDALLKRRVDGLILVNTPADTPQPVPVVAVSGHETIAGVTNIVVDHATAGTLAMKHLITELHHRKIAVLKGQTFSLDSEPRWQGIRDAAKTMGAPIDPRLVLQLEGTSPDRVLGREAAETMLRRGQEFTALFAFNDITAMGAIQALRQAGLRVPEDVSVLGFDDIAAAETNDPPLSTVRQPLNEMGMKAAAVVLDRLANQDARHDMVVTVEPTLVTRSSTAACPVRSNATRR